MHTAPTVNQLFRYPEYLSLLAVGASHLLAPCYLTEHTDRTSLPYKGPANNSPRFCWLRGHLPPLIICDLLSQRRVTFPSLERDMVCWFSMEDPRCEYGCESRGSYRKATRYESEPPYGAPAMLLLHQAPKPPPLGIPTRALMAAGTFGGLSDHIYMR